MLTGSIGKSTLGKSTFGTPKLVHYLEISLTTVEPPKLMKDILGPVILSTTYREVVLFSEVYRNDTLRTVLSREAVLFSSIGCFTEYLLCPLSEGAATSE